MMTRNHFFLYLCLLIIVVSCTPDKKETPKASITKESFGKLPDGREVLQYVLASANGIEMKVINYGGIITSLKVPDKEGTFEDIVLGYDKLDDYLKESPYFGAIIGRYGNRIGGGTFVLDSVEYTLATNNGPNHLHGGVQGFDKVFWEAKEITNDQGVGLELSYTSADSEEGYPGKLDVVVTYLLGNDSTLTFDYKATTDAPTIVNLTQHSYFNLSAMEEDILSHVLEINASNYLPIDSTLIPFGDITPVEGTPFDFTEPKVIGRDIAVEDVQMVFGGGFDHCWVLDKEAEDEMTFAASLYEPKSGRFMEIFTTEPGIQFYSGNFLDGSLTGKGGRAYDFRDGLCLETQHYPDSPNKPDFPSVILRPGEEYHTVTRHKFSTK